MRKPPYKLVETWLTLAMDTRPEHRLAKQAATTNLINIFGTIDVAQIYLEQSLKKLTVVVAEEA
ncbi:hypothetical protein [Colwellia sp. E150_009]